MIDLLIRRARLTPAGRELAGAHLSAVGPVDIHIDSGRFTAVAAHAGSAVVNAYREAHLAQVMEGVQAAKTGPEDHDVVVLNRSVFLWLWWSLIHDSHGRTSTFPLRPFRSLAQVQLIGIRPDGRVRGQNT